MSHQDSSQDTKINAMDLWDARELGADERHVRKSTRDAISVDDKLELQMISIRLQKGLIEDLKNIAEIEGLGYQPLMKRVLARFVEAEKKQILKERIAEQRCARDAIENPDAELPNEAKLVG